MRINEEIKVKEVRLIDADGGSGGVISIEEALEKAESAGFDLVEVSPTATPPVCKIIDYGKFLYQKEKKAKEAKKKQKIVEIKEMKFGPKIDTNDFDYRMKRIRGFLEKGDKVKITIRFRGREITHKELGFALVDKIIARVSDLCAVEKKPKLEGRNIGMVLSPLKTK